jgi:hypothetical protein
MKGMLTLDDFSELYLAASGKLLERKDIDNILGLKPMRDRLSLEDL